MQPFTLQAACRLEKGKRIWDTNAGKWITQPERIVANPPQNLTAEQTAFLKERADLLAETIRLDAALRRYEAEQEKAGPMDLLYLHYSLLQHQGFGEIEETPSMQQLVKYAWHLVDRYNDKEITWARLKSEIEDWYLLICGKLDARRGPVLAHV